MTSKDECRTLYSEYTPQDGKIELARWPEGYVLWHHGEIVWKSWMVPVTWVAEIQGEGGRGGR